METKSDISKSLYHYTDIGAVASIVRNKKLWLTNIGFLNDSQEMLDGLSVVQQQLNKELSRYESDAIPAPSGVWFLKGAFDMVSSFGDIHNVYTCSFSRAPNLLSQWRAYGNFSIEFSRAELEKDHLLYDCIYDSSLKLESAKRIFDEAVENISDYFDNMPAKVESVKGLAMLMAKIGTFKNQYFEAEHEVRIVGASNQEGHIPMHRARGDYLVPYLEVGVRSESILAIHIGPIANQDLAEKSLISLLRYNGLGNIPIIKSDIPYRS